MSSDKTSLRNYLIKNDAYVNVFFRHIRAEIKAVDENKVLSEKKIKTLTNDQEDLCTHLEKLKKNFRNEQKKTTDQLEKLRKKMKNQFLQMMTAINNKNFELSQAWETYI